MFFVNKPPFFLIFSIFAYLIVPVNSIAGSGKPIARIKESVICCPSEEFILDGWASIDLDGEVIKWMWDIDGDDQIDTVLKTGEIIVVAPSKPSLYAVGLKVVDNEKNESDMYTATVRVMDGAPTVFLGNDTTVKVGTRVSFDPKVHFNCGKAKIYEWDFGNDGTVEYKSSENAKTSRQYLKAGKYQARFRVENDQGAESGGIQTIYVITDVPGRTSAE